MTHDGILYAWKETEHNDVRIELQVWNHRFVIVWRQNVMVVEGKVDAHIAEMGMVEGVEGMKTFRINLDGSVASQQSAIKEDAYLWNHRSSFLVLHRSQFYSSHEVLLSVGSQLTNWQLASCEDDRFGEVFQHKGKG